MEQKKTNKQTKTKTKTNKTKNNKKQSNTNSSKGGQGSAVGSKFEKGEQIKKYNPHYRDTYVPIETLFVFYVTSPSLSEWFIKDHSI